MPQKQNDIKHYSAEELERYHSGKMTQQEMHALEKAALDDPFLSDALDGYVFTTTGVTDINELNNKLLEKATGNKTIPFKTKPIFSFLKIAAVLILFTGIGWFLYNKSSREKPGLAKVDEPENKNEITVTSDSKITDTSLNKRAAGSVAIVPADELREQQAPVIINKTPDSTKEKITVQAATGYALDQTSVAALPDSLSNTKANNFYTNIQQESGNNIDNAVAGKNQGYFNNAPKKIRGRITDSKGNPVSFANVIDKKNNIGVQSDKEGTFALFTPDTAPKVDINAYGYKAITKALSNDSMANNLVLLERDYDAFKKEAVAITPNKTKQVQWSKTVSQETISKDQKTERISITNAIPLNGWQDFYKYVSDSLKTLEQLGPTSVGTEVLVSFDINKDGKPIDIQVKRSLCVACDAEALRIIRNSPSMKLNKKRKKPMQ